MAVILVRHQSHFCAICSTVAESLTSPACIGRKPAVQAPAIGLPRRYFDASHFRQSKSGRSNRDRIKIRGVRVDIVQNVRPRLVVVLMMSMHVSYSAIPDKAVYVFAEIMQQRRSNGNNRRFAWEIWFG